MFKFILSIYVLSILLIAGFAKASTDMSNTVMKMQRVQFNKQILLPVNNINYDQSNDVLTIEGANEGFCLDSIKTHTRIIAAENRAVVTVSGADKNCHERTRTYSKSFVLADVFAQHESLKGQIILVKIANSDKSFEYELF